MKIAPQFLIPFALLAGCGSPQPAEKAEGPATGLPAEATPATPTATSAPPATETATSIPQPIQGRWGLVAADCASTRGDAKGLLTIDPTSLKFYESLGTLTAMRERTATRIVADFAFTGEGMEWQRVMTLAAQDGGKTLIRRENGEGAVPGVYKYRRCA